MRARLLSAFLALSAAWLTGALAVAQDADAGRGSANAAAT